MQTEAHDPKFTVEKAVDPNQLLAIRQRELVCDDHDISDGAARLFVRLLDLSLNKFLNGGVRGRIVISQTKLRCMLNCDERSIRRYAQQLATGNYLWTNLVAGIGTKPITAWHITAFCPQRQIGEVVPGQGLIGNGKRRYDTGFKKTGREATGQQRRVGGGLVDHRGQPLFFNLPDNAPVRGQNEPLTPDKIDRSEGTAMSSDRGQICPVTEDSVDLSHRSKLSGVTGQNCPVTEGAGVRHKESQLGDRVPIGVKGGPTPPDLGFEKTIKGLFPSRLQKMKAEMEGKLKSAKSATARAEWKRRIALVEDELYGGPVTDEAEPVRILTKIAARPESKLTEAQLLQGAEYLVQIGKENLLTAEQRTVLKRSGKIAEELWASKFGAEPTLARKAVGK